MTMKTLILTLSAAGLMMSACSQATAPEAASTTATPLTQTVALEDAKTKAVLTYAKWCSSCKILEPKIKTLRAENDIPSVAFVTLDYTNKDKEDFYAQARAAGVEDVVREHFDGSVTTGLLLLIDADDNIILETIRKGATQADMLSTIESAVAAS